MRLHADNRAIARLLTVALVSALLLACEEPAPPLPEVVRPVKAVPIDARADGSVRTFSGTIVASEVSELGFRIGGTIQTVGAELGQRVRRGQVLATLDRTPMQLRVQQALAEVRDAEARRAESRESLGRTRALFEAGAASRADFDSTTAAAKSASSALAAARASLGLARRDLEAAELEAPFDGVVAERNVEPFEEVAPGHSAFVLHTEGGVELEVMLPDIVIDRVELGDPVSVQLSQPNASRYSARIKEIGSVAVETGGFPVQVAIDSDDPQLRPGLAATGTFSLPNDEEPAWLVPINAFLPPQGGEPTDPLSEASTAREADLFVLQEDAGVVRRRRVFVVGVRGNDVLVSEGLSEGELVVVAGVSFLYDGQRARLYESAR